MAINQIMGGQRNLKRQHFENNIKHIMLSQFFRLSLAVILPLLMSNVI